MHVPASPRAPRAGHAAETAGRQRALVALLGTERIAVPLSAAVAVVAAPAVVPLPLAPAYLRGVGVWQGHLIPALDLSRLLGLPDAPSTPEALVLRQGEQIVALLVSRVQGEADLTLAPDAAAHDRSAPDAAIADLLAGTARAADDTAIRLLDTHTLFALANLSAVLD